MLVFIHVHVIPPEALTSSVRPNILLTNSDNYFNIK